MVYEVVVWGQGAHGGKVRSFDFELIFMDKVHATKCQAVTYSPTLLGWERGYPTNIHNSFSPANSKMAVIITTIARRIRNLTCLLIHYR